MSPIGTFFVTEFILRIRFFGKFDLGIFGYVENDFWAILRIWIFRRFFAFSNFRSILDRTIHNSSYVDLYMDRTLNNSVLKLLLYGPRIRIKGRAHDSVRGFCPLFQFVSFAYTKHQFLQYCKT